MDIVKLKPYCAKAIWGGKNLNLKYGKKDYDEIAESWELSGYPGKESIAVGGKYDGKTINEIISICGKAVLGTKAEKYDKFPMLIKLIDAASPLSIQVHPSDENAKALGADGGKTEMWIICDCEKDAFLYFGVKERLSAEQFKNAILDGSITEYLNKVPVKPGDTFFIEAGTIHAIGAGITICEIQQTSDTTYRLYDYKRKDKDGNERELHIEKGMIASNLEPISDFYEKGEMIGNELRLVSCPFFNVSRINVKGSTDINVDCSSFAALTITEGVGEIQNGDTVIEVSKGDTVFVPASSGDIYLDGVMTVIKSTL
ncbi:MAG: class I mannose-6-phosphate isomerase [Clostridia bacterium]|nr:class I mannose-6-phosphate isomerase [Clostridia bacterium]